MFVCIRCKGKFFQKEFLKKQKLLPAENVESIPLEQTPTFSKIQEKNIRTSTRRKMSYSSTTESQKRCIICNEEKKEKGRIVALTMIEMRENDTKKHKAEETLLQFANIHVRHKTKYKAAAERILLVSSTLSLFAAVCYHREECYAFPGVSMVEIGS